MRCNFDDVEICQAYDRRNVVIYSLGNFVCAKTKLHKKNCINCYSVQNGFHMHWLFILRKKKPLLHIFLLVSTNQNKRFNLHVTFLKHMHHFGGKQRIKLYNLKSKVNCS